MVKFKIPNVFQKGDDINFEISGGAGATGDTFAIVNEDGERVKLLGSYLKDNDFGETITGTIENAKDSSYKLKAFGGRLNEGGRMVYDNELVQFQSNDAQIIPNAQPETDPSDNNKNMITKLFNKKTILAGVAVAGIILIR